MWVKVNIGTGAVEKQNYSRRDLKDDNSLQSFPKAMSAATLAIYGVHIVIVDDKIAFDEAIENGVRETTVTKVGDTYHLKFTVTAKTAQEQTDYFDAKVEELISAVEETSRLKAISGFTVSSDFVPTDDMSLHALFATGVNTANSRRVKKGKGQFETLNPAQLKTRREAIDDFLQGVVDNEDSLSIDINTAADITALLAIDIEAGWPT